MSRTQPRALALTAAVALSGLLLSASPVAAAPQDRIAISHDGKNYAHTMNTELFADAGRVVPGDKNRDRVWVKSVTDEPGRLRLWVSDAWSNDAALSNATTVTITLPGGKKQTTPLAAILEAGSCLPIAPDSTLDPGQVAKIDASLNIDSQLGAAHGDDGVLKKFGFQIKATLSDASVDTEPSCEGDGSGPATPTPSTPAPTPSIPGGGLPQTGAQVLGGMVLGLGMAIGGGYLAAARKRRKGAHE